MYPITPSANTTSWRFGSAGMESWLLRNSVSDMTSFRGSQGWGLGVPLRASPICLWVSSSVAPRLTSPLWPTLMKAHIGWKAPVPQARRWVRLWGCRRRTKLAHSVCGTQKRGHALTPRVAKKYSKRHILYATLPTCPLSGCTNISGSLLIPSFAIPTTTQKQISAADGKRPDECRGSANPRHVCSDQRST